ncbi:GntR family transcriptional regulator [Streptomyces sp. NPDC091376]|uniref:GntR family transcriptional regulator n=1 Tax=Streptomyces sp. NPDC091376 TaxID=3365994 RepID=UPI0037FFC6B4
MPSHPKYQRIADDLRSEIIGGRLVAGDRLPGENELMERYSVARMTARQALSVLQAEGLTDARKGAGVFVRASSSTPRIRRRSGRMSREVWGAGKSVWVDDVDPDALVVDRVSVGREPASEYVADALSIPAGALVVARSRRYVVDGCPVMLAASHVPADIAKGSAIEQEDTGPGGVFARLIELGRAPVRFQSNVTARSATAHERQALSLRGDAVVLCERRLAVDEGGSMVELSELVMDAAVFILQYDYSA